MFWDSDPEQGRIGIISLFLQIEKRESQNEGDMERLGILLTILQPVREKMRLEP